MGRACGWGDPRMMHSLAILICIALGGGFGALARDSMMALMHGFFGLPVFLALGIVNVSGSLLIGFVFGRLEGSLNRRGGSRLTKLPQSANLKGQPWWPEGDPTLPAVDILRYDTKLQLASALLITGFLGGYTTFSALSLLTVQMVQGGEWITALLSAVGSVVLGLMGVWIGVHVGCRSISKD